MATKKEISTELVELGISFNLKASKKELLQLLNEATSEAKSTPLEKNSPIDNSKDEETKQVDSPIDSLIEAPVVDEAPPILNEAIEWLNEHISEANLKVPMTFLKYLESQNYVYIQREEFSRLRPYLKQLEKINKTGMHGAFSYFRIAILKLIFAITEGDPVEIEARLTQAKEEAQK